MTTRSRITALCKDGKYRSVYCHFDGYLDHVGKILFYHFETQEKIEELLSHGDISSLDHTIDTSQFYYKMFNCQIEFGVGDTIAEAYGPRVEYYDYEYLWDGEQWNVMSGHLKGGKWWFNLGEMLALEGM